MGDWDLGRDRSRLCVKNLPKHADERRLREVFSQKGEVTDAKLIRTKDGKSRQFAFVGFRTKEEAEEALKYFNNSYIDTCKITCEVARKVGDLDAPRPWSRHSLKKCEDGKNAISNRAKNAPMKNSKSQVPSFAAADSKGGGISDPKFQEFLEVMQPRAKAKMWANDTVGVVDIVDQDSKADEKKSAKSEAKVEVMENDSSSEDASEDELQENRGDDRLTDTDYFKSRMKKNWSDSESDEEDSKDQTDISIDDEDSSGELHDVNQNDALTGQESDLDKETDVKKETFEENSESQDKDDENPTSTSDEKKLALDTGRLFFRNLPYTTTEDDLVELFSQFGDVSQVHLVVDKITKRSKGIGYVLFSLPDSAVRALKELDNSIFQGRLLHVMPAKPQNDEKIESDHGTIVEKKSFKKLREEQRKASEASGDTRAWNTLFMRPDTVVENIARKNGISKGELLDREADDLAIRIALGETHIIAETKKSLSRTGINVVALEEFASRKNEKFKRSNHVILVKNLPYSSSEEDLATMFGKFGSLDKVILPPTRALALVVFLEATEAHTAFKCLAYKRYKDTPLYLEWAPDNILCPTPISVEEEEKNAVGERIVTKAIVEQTVEGVAAEDVDPDRVESRSVFVKNLNFKTSDESVKQHFSAKLKSGAIKSVKVKKNIKNGKNVSMGFGFIEFDSVETATNVCKDLQGTVLDGHALILQLCHGRRDSRVLKKDDKDKSSTKLIVRNVAFEATEKDLRQLFSPFGQIKSLRLPMKFGSHRGFAFVEYVTKQETQSAVQALASTHLYGRHLVIERAKEGETLEELRAKTAAQFVDEAAGFQRLSKKRKQTSLVDEGSVKFSRIVE